MAFNAEGTPNVPRNRIRLRQCQLYMEGRIGGSAQNTPNEIYTSKPPVGHLPRHNNHMHQPAPFTADDMGTYGQNFSNQMAPNGPRPPFIPINSSHLNGTADYTARKISGIHHFYLNQMVPSPSPSPPSSSLTRNIRMFSLRYSTQMHMAPSFPPLGHMHDPRSINELSFDNPRGVRDSGHFSPSSSLSNNNGQGLNPVSAINNNGQGFNPVSAINNNEQDPHPVTLHRREQAQNPPTQSQHTLHNTPSPPPPPIPQTAPSVSPLPAPPKFALVYPCHHEFCLGCIQYWIQTQQKRVNVCVERVTCPLCRGTIQRVIDRDGEVIGSGRSLDQRGHWIREKTRDKYCECGC
ncbi:hypothetical protein sscle_03g026880 [Sclerotinia sclerotiorum 1980 UF-70]|uniref:RING-type domain-containing protein n=1 Tax=Sclerotinia sclerotiorum (strain ATCC 18683 / 1980 / Ss-1) TaxID=665079 RepID=A0A1D9PYW4_SCLS1|nr:hypothetical protein sscle_03g026880 [Sclerotinia sclerotiorum 1980 UF-70]